MSWEGHDLVLVDTTTTRVLGRPTDAQAIALVQGGDARGIGVIVADTFYGSREVYLARVTSYPDARKLRHAWIPPCDPIVAEIVCHHICALARIAGSVRS